MKKTTTDRPRGFRLMVEPSRQELTIALEETNGSPEHIERIVSIGSSLLPRFHDQLARAFKQSGLPPSILDTQRPAIHILNEETGVRLALVLLAAKPIKRGARVEAIKTGVERMSSEEAYYWYAKCMGSGADRSRRALRLLLAAD